MPRHEQRELHNGEKYYLCGGETVVEIFNDKNIDYVQGKNRMKRRINVIVIHTAKNSKYSVGDVFMCETEILYPNRKIKFGTQK
jgi:hypothetical protein